MKSNSSISAIVGSPLSGSVGSPTVDRQVSQVIKPLRVVVEEIRALKEMGKDPIGKDEGGVRRLLNTLHRVFTVGALGNNYGRFWEFLLAVEEQINRNQQHQGTALDRFTRDITQAKDRVGRMRLSSQGPMGAFEGDGDHTSQRFSSNGSTALLNPNGFPLPTIAQEKALVRSIEHVRSFNMSNKLNCLHYWLITALQQGGILAAALTSAVVPMCDVLQAFMGPESFFYATQSSTSVVTGDVHTAALCFPFLTELLRVFEDLERHPEMGAINYCLDITCMQLFQTVTDKNGNLIVGVNGADNNEQIEFFVPNAIFSLHGRGRGKRRRRPVQSVGVNTDAQIQPDLIGSPLRSQTTSQYPIAPEGMAGLMTQYLSDASALVAFYGGSAVVGEGCGRREGIDSLGRKKVVLTFTELCEMQDALQEEKKTLKAKDDALSEREKAIELKEQEVQEASKEIVEVLIKLKDLYIKHVVGLRERQEMGMRITSKDIDRKIPQLLHVLEDGDFDMVADEDELNAAGLATKGSQKRFYESPESPHDSQPPSVVSSRQRTSSVAIGCSPTAGVKPLVIVDPDDAIPPHKVAGLIALRVTDPQEKGRDDQLKAQSFLCADCGVSFGSEGNQNVLLKTFQKTSEILTMQKPRRCHYCTQLLCHNCHSNQTALLPFRVVPKWDFSNRHVCKRCHTFLQNNFHLAHFDIRKIPREVVLGSSVLQQCASLRKYIIRAALIISGCTRPSSASFAQDLHTHYFQKEFFYSLSDFNTIHNTERRESNPAHIVPGVSNVVGAMQWVAGVNVDNLVERLAAKLVQCKQHIKVDCANCKVRSSMQCTICNVPQPVFVVDEDGTQCRKCHNIYHTRCMESKGCPSCTGA